VAQGGQVSGQGQTGPGVPAGSDPLAGIIPQEGQKIDPQEFASRAEAAAQYLVQIPESQRFGELKRIREANSFFHGMVKQKLEKMRSEARSKGQQLYMQQAWGAQG
jgi:hypothetical protein